MQTKLFGLTNPKPGDSMYIFGADRLGRDIFSRVIHGAQVSLSIGLVGVFMSLILGVMLGGISGFFGGWIDLGIQRVIEFAALDADHPALDGLRRGDPARTGRRFAPISSSR